MTWCGQRGSSVLHSPSFLVSLSFLLQQVHGGGQWNIGQRHGKVGRGGVHDQDVAMHFGPLLRASARFLNLLEDDSRDGTTGHAEVRRWERRRRAQRQAKKPHTRTQPYRLFFSFQSGGVRPLCPPPSRPVFARCRSALAPQKVVPPTLCNITRWCAMGNLSIAVMGGRDGGLFDYKLPVDISSPIYAALEELVPGKVRATTGGNGLWSEAGTHTAL